MSYDEALHTHCISVESRSRAAVTGVEGVENFDDVCVVMNTSRGALAVRGSGLHLEKLSLDSGEVVIEGSISGFEYEDEARPAGSFLSKLFH